MWRSSSVSCLSILNGTTTAKRWGPFVFSPRAFRFPLGGTDGQLRDSMGTFLVWDAVNLWLFSKYAWKFKMKSTRCTLDTCMITHGVWILLLLQVAQLFSKTWLELTVPSNGLTLHNVLLYQDCKRCTTGNAATNWWILRAIWIYQKSCVPSIRWCKHFWNPLQRFRNLNLSLIGPGIWGRVPFPLQFQGLI